MYKLRNTTNNLETLKTNEESLGAAQVCPVREDSVSSVDIIPTRGRLGSLNTPIIGQLLRELTSGLSMNTKYLGLQKTTLEASSQPWRVVPINT